MADFEHLVLKKYEFFTLYLNRDQRYLGRAYAWLNRAGDMQLFSQLSLEELRELQQVVIREYEKAIRDLWLFDLVNYAWLGNHVHAHAGHGHMHLIPRYQAPRSFNEISYVDDRWGQNYAPYTEFKSSDEELFAIRDAIRFMLPGSGA